MPRRLTVTPEEKQALAEAIERWAATLSEPERQVLDVVLRRAAANALEWTGQEVQGYDPFRPPLPTLLGPQTQFQSVHGLHRLDLAPTGPGVPPTQVRRGR